MNKTKTIFILILSTTTLILSIGIFVFFFKIIKNKNIHTSVVISTIEEKIINNDNKEAILNKYNEIEDEHEIINGHFVDATNIDVFVEYLEKLGSEKNINTTVNSVELSKKEKNMILVKISLEGDVKNIMQVVSLIENSPYQIRIDSFYLNKQIETKIEAVNEQTKNINNVPLWQADVSFNVLSL